MLGTELLFAGEQDPQDRNRRSVVHVSSTEQRVTFKEVQFKGQETTGSQCTDVDQAAGPSAAKTKEGTDMGLNLLGQI